MIQLCDILSRSNMAARSYSPDALLCMCALLPWPWRYDLGQGHDTSLGHGHQLCEISRPNWRWGVMARARILGMCVLWPWNKRYNLGSRSWHTLGSWTIIMWNIIQIQFGSEELWSGHGFSVYVHCDLDLGDMTLGQDHDTPFGHGQQLCEILSRSNKAVRSYGPDTDLKYVRTVTLT